MNGLTNRGSSPSLRAAAMAAASTPGGTVPWAHLLRLFWWQYVGLAVLIVVLAISESATPYRHVLYNHSDNEIWKYSYPLKANTVKPWMVPCISVLTPLSFIAVWFVSGRMNVIEAHHAAMSALVAVAFTGLTTNFIKVEVGRFRPHFVERCWPDGGEPVFESDGRPRCSDAAVNPLEGMKSFPSGHTAWSTAGLAWTAFFLIGKLQAFAGGGPLRLVVSLLPVGGAVWIGASRLQDYWHHWEDVTVGFILGLLMAWAFYRSVYAAPTSDKAGTLLPTLPAVAESRREGSHGHQQLRRSEGSYNADDKV